MNGPSFLIGMVIGIGITLMYFGVVLLLLERELSNPFRHVTVADFEDTPEGG